MSTATEDTLRDLSRLHIDDDDSDPFAPYDMTSTPTGHCYVYNSIQFKNCYPRTGCDKDFPRIKATFSRFGFVVEERKDRTVEQMREELIQIASKYDPQLSSIVIFFNSHGLSGDRLFDVEGNCVEIRELVRYFNGANCQQLVGKPKLFFVEMCRGGRVVEEEKYASSTAPSLGKKKKKILPVDQDILMAFSTGYGAESYYDYDKGSWFIQTLTEVLQKYGHKEDIYTLLQRTTALIGKKAGAHEGNNMCPHIESSLSRPLKFKVVQG